ncbi:UNVERIFIED_CONTAM: hypothetical protein Slati_1398700 [Sesamum latifolium]|uniref:Retrotransposon gag domain-containing protein n=1 Tax=Sesamum latifolium TaxID=2727402 RepID=A0AAW2X3H7_9LAMI
MDTQEKAVKLVNSKLTISKSSCLSTKSIDVTTRNMLKKIKDSSQMTPLTKYVQKDLGSSNHASEDDRNKSPPSSPRSVSSHSFTTNMASVMVDHKADNVDASHIMGKQVEAHDEAEVSTKQRYTENDKFAKELQVSSDGLIPMDQLKEFIEGTIRRTYGDHLIKQFVRSLKENAFDWYTNLEAGSIDGWEQLEQEFLYRFYNTRRIVSIVELTNSRQ